MEEADVGKVVAEHDEAIDAAAPGEAVVFDGVDAGHFEDVGVDHAAAEHFEVIASGGVGFFAEGGGFFDHEFEGWFGEGEVAGLGFDL